MSFAVDSNSLLFQFCVFTCHSQILVGHNPSLRASHFFTLSFPSGGLHAVEQLSAVHLCHPPPHPGKDYTLKMFSSVRRGRNLMGVPSEAPGLNWGSTGEEAELKVKDLQSCVVN